LIDSIDHKVFQKSVQVTKP